MAFLACTRPGGCGGERIRFERICSKVETSKHDRRGRVCPRNLWFLFRFCLAA
ncbi:hypothetical protein MUK42_36802 [Musa troglodytarum]|uniref:Uncharacterized protein n=1 Tax=Musa troglodytarum TaxID=320322 RepID=A0A9E7EEE3_9LILI|nr:hypothetical protein MUK42_36802 [Musa troglodytarum]